MPERSDYYVYVYIDPRSYEEFYYGKGCRGRKESHLGDARDSDKTKRIRAIRKDGEEPIIRVIAKGLTEHDALLVETTLIWKQGRYLTNLTQGNFSKHFRPAHRMHMKLPDFDFFNDIYYVNVAEGPHRSWDDCRKLGFVAAGNGRNWSEQLNRLHPGDVAVAYLKGKGFAGIGVVNHRAVRVKQFRFKGKPLQRALLKQPGLFENSDNHDLAQYLVGVSWEKMVPHAEAKFQRNAGLYTPQSVVASLANQPKTKKFIDEAFGVSLDELATGATAPGLIRDGRPNRGFNGSG
jgi:uncharacterized protein